MRRQHGRKALGRWFSSLTVLCMAAVAVTAMPAAAEPDHGPADPTTIAPECYAPDIGTVETALGIDSHVDEVCFESPQLEDRGHMKFYTVDLSITGVDSSPWAAGFTCGYGFAGWDPDCGHRQAAYAGVSVTLWFPTNWEQGKNKTLVQYHHSSPFNPTGEELIGLGAIQQGMAYADHDLADGLIVDGPMAGSPVPLVSSSMTRDVASVASDWLDRYTGRAPDLRYIEMAAETIGPITQPGATVILESTTYPGTTEELVGPIIERRSGLQAGRDFYLGYSPERIDPGNRTHTLETTPKVVSGIGPASLAKVKGFYDRFVETTVAVSSIRWATAFWLSLPVSSMCSIAPWPGRAR